MADIFSWYNDLINNYPLPTKVLTSALLFGVGDVIMQGGEMKRIRKFDFWRCVRMMVWGFLYGMINHFWYLLLTNIHISNMLVLAIVKTIIDQLIASPILNTSMFIVCSLLETCTNQPMTAWNEVKSKLWPTMKVSLCIWPFVQLFNFLLVPVQYQVLTVNVISLFWNAFLSFQTNRKDLTRKSPVLPVEDVEKAEEKKEEV